MRVNGRELSVPELTEILDGIQENLEDSKHRQEVMVLKGSYGVYLHDLRRKDMPTAQVYIDWMHQYNVRRGGSV